MLAFVFENVIYRIDKKKKKYESIRYLYTR